MPQSDLTDVGTVGPRGQGQDRLTRRRTRRRSAVVSPDRIGSTPRRRRSSPELQIQVTCLAESHIGSQG
eukprot:5539138-Pleurochrysis_carterae.AAC.5